MKMEETYFTSPKMTYKPEDLLARAMKTPNFDQRFILEEFRYNQITDKTYASKQGARPICGRFLKNTARSPLSENMQNGTLLNQEILMLALALVK